VPDFAASLATSDNPPVEESETQVQSQENSCIMCVEYIGMRTPSISHWAVTEELSKWIESVRPRTRIHVKVTIIEAWAEGHLQHNELYVALLACWEGFPSANWGVFQQPVRDVRY
jgi:hypothetical protein